MNVGYIRVSKQEQHEDLQRDALTAAKCDKLFTDKISGAATERKGLVLQPHLVSQANCTPFDMCSFGPGLMSPAPVGPAENSLQGRWSLPHQPPKESAHLRNRQGKELSGFLFLNLDPLFCPATLTTVKKARANIASVICRYHPCQ